MKPFFSIIVVALNPGSRLLQTLQSIEAQSCTDYEVVIKDGGSKDSSREEMNRFLEEKQEFAKRVRFFCEPDKSIYDAMNQAVKYAAGEYFYFLNCGDLFYAPQVLHKMQAAIQKSALSETGRTEEADWPGAVFYGDIYDALRQERVASNPRIDAFACYRHVPCHQACFYGRKLFESRGYHTEYKVRADYEHFLWCFFKAGAQIHYVPVIMVSYEGGGYSETKESRKRSKEEHKKISAVYFTVGQRLRYRLLLWLSLAWLRSRMAESRRFSRMYQKIKRFLYGRR